MTNKQYAESLYKDGFRSSDGNTILYFEPMPAKKWIAIRDLLRHMEICENQLPTPADLQDMERAGYIRRHHTALERGYISVKEPGIVKAYSGRFGYGFTLEQWSGRSNRHHDKIYFVWTDKGRAEYDF